MVTILITNVIVGVKDPEETVLLRILEPSQAESCRSSNKSCSVSGP